MLGRRAFAVHDVRPDHGGTVEFINGNDYPNLPNVGEGYQGSGYFDTLLPLGLCYQTILQSDPTTAAKYGAKGVAILMAKSCRLPFPTGVRRCSRLQVFAWPMETPR